MAETSSVRDVIRQCKTEFKLIFYFIVKNELNKSILLLYQMGERIKDYANVCKERKD